MRWNRAVFLGAIALATLATGSAFAQEAGSLAGRWTLSHASSQFPREVGFGVGVASGEDAGGEARLSPALLSGRESEDDARRAAQLTEEVRTPSEHLVIVDTAAAVTITDDRGRSRTFHPAVREDVIQLDGVPVAAAARREAGRLVVTYRVQQDHEVRYTYSRTAIPPQLVVDVQFVERGAKSSVRRVYEPAKPGEPLTAPRAAPASSRGTGPDATRPQEPAPGLARPAGGAPAPPDRFELPRMPQRPGDEFKGLTSLSVVVEDLGSQAATCGLKQAAVETTVSKAVSDAGLKILRNSDEDTFLYVNINTSKVSTGFCVSRYDVMLYTHATAQLPYGTTPVLVQVSLLRDGGMAGGDPAANAAAVLRGVKEAVDRFGARIREANK